MTNDDVFKNPNNVPLDELKLSVSNDGLIVSVPALDKYWVEDRTLSYYTPMPKEVNSPFGALQTWKDSMQWFVNDLKWLLSVDHHRFWSNIIHNPRCMNMLVSFLQEANPPYIQFKNDKSVTDLYNQAYKRVFVIFSRLITNKESPDKWLSIPYMSDLIYDKYIFTIPIMWDLCLIYGMTNGPHIKKMLGFVFQLQPKYYDDLQIAIEFVKQILRFVSLRVNNKPTILPENFKGFSKNFGGLHSNKTNPEDMLTLDALQDFALHILDCAVTIRLFLELHPPARKHFMEKNFLTSVASFYETGVTKMYARANELNTDGSEKLEQIYTYLDSMRMEFIDIYRYCLDNLIEDILGQNNIEENVNAYLTIITDCLSEKAFIRDYNSVYSIESDLDVLCQAYKDMDPIKCEFILEAVQSYYEVTPKRKSKLQNSEEHETPQNGHNDLSSVETSESPEGVDIPEDAKNQSLISEVKDILPDLGDGYVLKCLEFYNFDTARVINCILEGNLDASLLKLDPQLPIIPEEKVSDLYKRTGMERLNVFDFDEYDVMNRDDVDLSRVHKGKKKFEHKNLSVMLDDKSHIREMKDRFVKYSVVSDDDEYDDTYDDLDHNIVSEVAAEADRKPVSRVTFKQTKECLEESDDEENYSEIVGAPAVSKDQFCDNPEDLRAKYEARRQTKQGVKPDRDVVGKARGQGQEKDVLLNRQKKGANKSTRANHNRRSGAQWKKNQGMIHM